MAATARCILLTGAPKGEDLDWHEQILLTGFDVHFARVLHGQSQETDPENTDPFRSTAASKWRHVTLSDARNNLQSRPQSGDHQTQFLSLTESHGDQAQQHLDFLEHSVAVLDDLASSQILEPTNDASGLDATIAFSTSFATASATDSSFDTTEYSHTPAEDARSPHNLGVSGAISNLKQIPAADYISRILPQTMTVTLVVGVVAVSPPRTVHLKRNNNEMDIVELIVGDETRAGFTVSFWLAPLESQNKPKDDLRDVLRGLRAGDVVLLQNIALSCFRNCVYGQSLSKRFTRNSTSLTLVDDTSILTLPSNLRAKLQRVSDWACDFVGIDRKAVSLADTDENRDMARDALPPDTQD